MSGKYTSRHRGDVLLKDTAQLSTVTVVFAKRQNMAPKTQHFFFGWQKGICWSVRVDFFFLFVFFPCSSHFVVYVLWR